MFGGDDRVNRYVDEFVTPAARERGVTIERVPVADTAEAVQRVLAERRAGRTSGGAVDLIWINGENFATGKEAGLWLQGWVDDLPNSRFVDLDAPLIASDFGVPIDNMESPWARAAFVFAYDSERTEEPPGSVEELVEYAEENPGRVTYPAPPDFTGTSFVKQVIQAVGSEDEAFELLERMQPLQYRDGEVFPKSEAELNRLFGDGQVDFAMSFDPSFVANGVHRGQFPASARPFLLGGRSLQNVSYVAIPASAANQEGAQVVADVLLERELQARMVDPQVLGLPTVLDLDRLAPEQRRPFEEDVDSPHLLADFGDPLLELPVERVEPIEERWQQEILGGE